MTDVHLCGGEARERPPQWRRFGEQEVFDRLITIWMTDRQRSIGMSQSCVHEEPMSRVVTKSASGPNCHCLSSTCTSNDPASTKLIEWCEAISLAGS